jgi:hypothetical protein
VTPSASLLKTLMNNCPAEVSHDIYLAQELKRIEDIRRKLCVIRATRETEIAEQKRKLENLDKAVDKVRAECKHEATQFHPDPSGGSDRYTECLICGAEV